MAGLMIDHGDVLPDVTPEVGAAYLEQHGAAPSDEHIEDVLRDLAKSTPEYYHTIQRLANIVLDEEGIDAKFAFLRTVAVSVGLLFAQNDTDFLEKLLGQKST